MAKAKGKTKKFSVIPNPDLVQAWKGFRPVFGNDQDIAIAARAAALEAELETVDNKILRGPKEKHTEKMKSILFRESGLISAIISRNMDF